ncbi:IFIT5 protein, partial [Chloroceryle aenea]|nr:IFIT5 protein [Chloroceryle aenea]
STVSKSSLESSLHQLECHFTWSLPKEDVDLDDLEEKIVDQTEFLTKTNITNYNLLSYVCYLNNSEEKALRNLQKAEEEVKKNYPDEISRRSLVTWGNYAWIYYHMERYEDAQSYISKVENSCKKLSSTTECKIQLPEIYAEQGWALLNFGRKYYERAKVCFENALQSEPNNPEFNIGYAITMYRLEDYQVESKDGSLSLKPLKRAVELNAEDSFSMVLLALKLQDIKQVDEGEKYIEAAMQKNPYVPYVLRYAAKFYRRKGEVNKAVEILKKALQVTPRSVFLHHQLGLCYRQKLFRLKQARDSPQDQVDQLISLCIFYFKTVIEQKPKFFYAHTDLARMYAEAKQYEEAEETFQKAFQINILSSNDKQELYYYYGNFLHFHKKLYSEAIKYYIKGIKIEIDSYISRKCRSSLKKLLEQRIQRGVETATDFGTLGLVHNLDGEKCEAIECYEQAVALCPDNEEYLNALRELKLS